MLSDQEVLALEQWIQAARAWSESAQGLVGSATELTIRCLELADRIGDGEAPLASDGGDGRAVPVDREALSASLRLLAGSIEDEVRALRDSYLATAASIGQYTELLG